MGTITKSTKQGGGTDLNAGQSAVPADINDDINAVFNVINGNIEDVNMNASAAVQLTKLDHYSADATERDTESDPGAHGAAPSGINNMTDEVENLRYVVHRAVDRNLSGTGWRTAPNRALNTIGHRNLVPNGEFIAYTGAANSAPDMGWALEGTPTLAQTANATTVLEALGQGFHMKITGSGATDEGINYTFTDLVESTSYLFQCMAWVTSGDTAEVITTGGDTNLALSTTATTPTLLQGVFTTDSNATDVVLKLVASASTDVANFTKVTVVPLLAQPERQGYTPILSIAQTAGDVIEDETMTVGSVGDTITTRGTVINDGTNDLEASITVPDNNYCLKVTAKAAFGNDTTTRSIIVRLAETTDGGTTYVQRDVAGGLGQTISNESVMSLPLIHVDTSPTPGTTYSYRLQASINDNTSTDVQPQRSATAASPAGYSSILLELIPTG